MRVVINVQASRYYQAKKLVVAANSNRQNVTSTDEDYSSGPFHPSVGAEDHSIPLAAALFLAVALIVEMIAVAHVASGWTSMMSLLR